MSIEKLQVATLCAYLAAWLVLAVGAVAGALPRRRRLSAVLPRITVALVAGTLLQGAAVLTTTLSMSNQPLRPRTFELAGTLALAPLAASLFAWSLLSAPSNTGTGTLVTGGAYAWLRHPMYLAFLAMLVATGLLVSAGLKLIAAVFLYLAGSELRIASEEADLAERFPADYAQYRLRTRWRYLPGLR
jgi:protein-S-isoprenylcysteine O-methyltransferase Ste14